MLSLLTESLSGLSELLHKATREAVEATEKDLKEKLAGNFQEATCTLEAQVAELTQNIARLTAEGSQRDRQLEMAHQESKEGSILTQKVLGEAAKRRRPNFRPSSSLTFATPRPAVLLRNITPQRMSMCSGVPPTWQCQLQMIAAATTQHYSAAAATTAAAPTTRF
jgi:hypothetical protein